jgi:hypothetical protein
MRSNRPLSPSQRRDCQGHLGSFDEAQYAGGVKRRGERRGDLLAYDFDGPLCGAERSLDRRPLSADCALIFAILLLAFHIVEEGIRAWFESKPLSEALADLGGTLPGLLSYAAIFFVALIPFFAFREAARILGTGAIWNLFLHSGEKRFRLF